MKEFIRLEASRLLDNQNQRGLRCPKCNKSGCFSITKFPDKIKYQCFSASCALKGTIEDNVSLRPTTEDTKFTPKFFRSPLKSLTSPQRHLIESFWGIDVKDQILNGFKYDFYNHKLYLPIRNKEGNDVGANLKVFDRCVVAGGRHIKSMTYRYEESSGLDYSYDTLYNYTDSSKVLIVEDKLSAIRASKYLPAVSLGGVNLTEIGAKELAAKYKELIIALDADTWQNTKIPVATRLKDKYNLYFDKITMLYINRDIKNMTDHELLVLLVY